MSEPATNKQPCATRTSEVKTMVGAVKRSGAAVLMGVLATGLVATAACGDAASETQPLEASRDGGSADTEAGNPPAPAGKAGPCAAGWTPPFAVDRTLYPYAHQCFASSAGTLHYVDEGPRDAKETVVMVHGNPTWSGLYRSVIDAAVADGQRVIVHDYMGYGLSDRPALGAFPYTPAAQARLLEELVTELDLRNVTLVVQDWGGPVGLSAGGRLADRIARLLIMNTWAWPVSPSAPAEFHRLVDWSNLAHRQETQFVANCTMPRNSSGKIASTVDSSEGPLYRSVERLYLDPWIDPATDLPRSPEACRPTMVMAKSILDESAWLGEVEAGLARLAGKPTVLVVGRTDTLFGDLRCDVGPTGAGVCQAGLTCACEPDYLPPGTTCGTGPVNATRDAYVCARASDQRAAIPIVDRFTKLLGASSIRAVLPIKTSPHFIQEAGPRAVIEGLRALTDRPRAKDAYAYGPGGLSSAGASCDPSPGTSHWPGAPAGPIWMLDAVWYEDGGQAGFKSALEAEAPLLAAAGALPLSAADSTAMSHDASITWSCAGGLDPRALFELDADRLVFVKYPSIAAFDSMRTAPAHTAIDSLRCASVRRELLVPCVGPR